MKRGPKPNIKLDNKILSLRHQGKSFRVIGEIVNKDVKSVYRQYSRALASLSTAS